MSDTVGGYEYGRWVDLGLKDFGDFCESVSYVNTRDFGEFDEGDWYYADKEARVLYWGSYGNYNAPGSSYDTWAEVYGADEGDDFEKAVAEWEAEPETLDDDSDGYDYDDSEYMRDRYAQMYGENTPEEESDE